MNTLSLSALEAAARAWVGTPYGDNGCRQGIGASCHGLCWSLYREAGWEHGLPLGDGPSRWAGSMEGSPLIKFLADYPDRFTAVLAPRGKALPIEDALPGSMLGFVIGDEVRHAAIALPGGWMIHALRHYGVQLRSLADPGYQCRMGAVWYPRTLIDA